MIRRSLIVALAVCGLLALALGLQQWFDARAAGKTVEGFLDAVCRGDQASVLAMLAPDRRMEIEAQMQEGQRPFALSLAVDYDVQDVRVSGDSATAQLRIEKQGYAIQPVVHLSRGRTTRWKIDSIEGLDIDPRWEAARREQARQEGERLAEALQNALKDRPGVLRVGREEVPRRR